MKNQILTTTLLVGVLSGCASAPRYVVVERTPAPHPSPPDYPPELLTELRHQNCLLRYQTALSKCDILYRSEPDPITRNDNITQCLSNSGFPDDEKTCQSFLSNFSKSGSRFPSVKAG